jgi:putative copper resistance protein D
MALLLDLFGFLSVLLGGLATIARSLALGGLIFVIALARPLAARLGAQGDVLLARSYRLISWSVLALAVIVAATLAMQAAVLVDTTQIAWPDALGADFARSDLAEIAAALALAVACRTQAGRHPLAFLVLGLAIVGAATATSHAASRLDGRMPLAIATALHQIGAAAWIGGIPCFLMALAGSRDGPALAAIGRRFSLISMASVATIAAAGIVMATGYIDSIAAIYGTAYGVMVTTKVALFAGLLLLGAMNFRVVERLRRDPATPILRLRRFAEVELGVGISLFFAAASLTSLPPAADLTVDRVSAQEIALRMAPRWPSLTSPEHGSLAIIALQARLDAEAATPSSAPQAFIPGAGAAPPRNAADIAWSEYNHHWAGVVVLAIGLLCLAERAGIAPWARNWPLVFLLLAAFLLFRSDPEVWPLGQIGFFESLRDPEVVQHRVFALLTIAFGLFEWGVRTGRLASRAAAYVFPLATAIASALLLTHSHALANVKEELLIELTHVPLALLGITAGWTRWLELRLPTGRSAAAAAWVWPACFVLIGLLLLSYRES